jgi:hypothetical protein
MKFMVAAGWILLVCAMGVAIDASQASAWTMRAGICVVPPLLMLKFWHAPAQSLSESIRKETPVGRV